IVQNIAANGVEKEQRRSRALLEQHDRWVAAGVGLGADQSREFSNRAGLVERRNIERGAESLVDLDQHAHGLKRVAAQIQKTIIHADVFYAQDVAPHRRDLAL